MTSTATIAITIDRAPGNCVVRIKGDANVANVDEMERQLRPVAAIREPLVVFDLSELSFVSSLGISVLLNLQRGIRARGGVVRFAAPRQVIREVFKRCRLDAVLELYSSVDEAIADPQDS